ncbi:MAG TPA: NAD-dependent epimerase [Spirochaetia bacterium]|nr:NAD-dependent epimerase [Spirochaetia bacterium]
MKVLVTGAAGFIGFHLAKKLIERGDLVVGLDNLNDYYDVHLKVGRLTELGINPETIKDGAFSGSDRFPGFSFVKQDILNLKKLEQLFRLTQFDRVCHLAAQAGVRHSLVNPHAYIENNVAGFMNVLEACRQNHIGHLVFASSSSVYGLNESMPFSTRDNIDHPISLYAASKKSNELMAHSYSYLYDLPVTGLRFFTVYGPWGRPDMALFLFTKAILRGKPIDVFNDGQMKRDFTYIDDIVRGVATVLDRAPAKNPKWSGKKPDPASSPAPYRIYNIGNSKPVFLMDFIRAVEDAVGKKARENFLPLQPGDVPATWADTKDLEKEFGFKPSMDLRKGVKAFVDWYKSYYGA